MDASSSGWPSVCSAIPRHQSDRDWSQIQQLNSIIPHMLLTGSTPRIRHMHKNVPLIIRWSYTMTSVLGFLNGLIYSVNNQKDTYMDIYITTEIHRYEDTNVTKQIHRYVDTYMHI